MSKKTKELELTLQPVFVGKSFPAIWEGKFNAVPSDAQLRSKQAKIKKRMEEDLAEKVAAGKATPGYKLHYDWKKMPNESRRVFLKVTAERPILKGKDGSGGQETPPTPKSPPPPPQ